MYNRKCQCGTEFQTDNYRRKKCNPNCGRTSQERHAPRDRRREQNDITFVGVDGEGVDRPDGRHEYVMLSVGDQTLWNDGKQLDLQSILAFLWDAYQRQGDAAFVGFFLGYDFIQWLKLLPWDRARLLFSEKGIRERKSNRKGRENPYPDAVVWEGWELDIMAGRRFKLRPHRCHASEWSDKCRNRTCKREVAPEFDRPDLVRGEMDFVIPENNGTEFKGSANNFWGLFKRTRKVGKGAKKTRVAGWMYICDTGPFWQTSFLNVINPASWGDNPVCTKDEYETVVQGKADRGHVYTREDATYFGEMVKYNVLENDILARVTKRLNQGFMNERIPIKIPKADWYGPGRAAQLWMDQLHTLCADDEARMANKLAARDGALSPGTRRNETGLLNVDVYESMPTWFYEAAQSSYYGGWFEQTIHGHVEDVWEYDINSAYPYIIANLPCLHTTGIHNGQYLQGNGHSPHTELGNYTLLYGTVQGSNPYIGAAPYRTRQGLISRPHITKGWYWQHEIEAAKNAGLIDTVETERWVSFQPCTCTPPFNPKSIGIESLYQLRLDFGKNTPQGKSAKLVYNSAYGKTAQSIGTPKYSNPVYASLITAGCRTLILEAIATHPSGAAAVTMVATDGIYFTERHPYLTINRTQLGAWDETFKSQLTQLMPGVYWDQKTREAVGLGEAPKLKSRGVPARDLAKEIMRLDGMFAIEHMKMREGGEYTWPVIEFSSSFLLESCKSALNRGKWGEAGKVTHGKVRSISSDPKTKRVSQPYLDPVDGFVRTRPYTQGPELETTPYNKSFGYLEMQEGTDGLFAGMIGRDGDDGMQWFRDLLNGSS